MQEVNTKFRFPLYIQLFAEGDEGGAGSKDKDSDGEITFDEILSDTKYKSEFDRRVQKAIDTFKKNQETKKGGKETSEEGKPETKESGDAKADQFMAKYAQAEIKVAMTVNGIDPQKVARAVKLIDTSEVLTDSGDVDSTKLNESIANLLKEWPELKTSASSTSTNRIGSNRDDKGNQEKDPKQKYRDAIEAKIANDKAKK